MDRNEHIYRTTGRALIILLGTWLGMMLLALVLPTRFWTSGVGVFVFFYCVFPSLFVAVLVLSIIRIVAYIRWTGKYPYYFLFGKARPGNDGPENERNRTSDRQGP